MDEKQQLEWCQREHAAVWFGKGKVTLKVKDFKHSVTAQSLQAAITHVETVRQERKDIAAALTSLESKPS
jgi:hypothetical protein